MEDKEAIAASVAEKLGGSRAGGETSAWSSGTKVFTEAGREASGTMLELHPPPGAREVPVWVKLEHGYADLADLDFEPASVSIVEWDECHGEQGLIVGFPQMLFGPAVAGRRHEAPVAGGRRGDGRIELWIEPTPIGEMVAVIDADARLGLVGNLAWTSPAGDGRLLIALPESRGRRLGLASLPLNGIDQLLSIDLLVHPDLTDAAPDAALVGISVASARSQSAQTLWRQLAPVS